MLYKSNGQQCVYFLNIIFMGFNIDIQFGTFAPYGTYTIFATNT